MTPKEQASTVICGAGIAGIATAYWLSVHHKQTGIVIADSLHPMSLTSAASGENFRNWWPQQHLAELADRSISLMHQLAGPDGEHFRISQNGYAYATRTSNANAVVGELEKTYGHVTSGGIRIHDRGPAPPDAGDGADILLDRSAIRERYPHLSEHISIVTLVRRAGDIDSQQLGQFMLGEAKERGVRLAQVDIQSISRIAGGFQIETVSPNGPAIIEAETFINAAGPFAGPVAAMLDADLPLDCIYQQKIAFEDVLGIVPRDAPFTIDEDAGPLDWTDEARELLLEDPQTAPLAGTLPGGVHVRPEGGKTSRWIKLGWATNITPEQPVWQPSGDDTFPEVVMRGAARLVPGLASYCDALPRTLSHYGGYYTRTRENWPLIGPMGPQGAFMVAGLSGYGTMMACAAGELCAAWVTGKKLPGYARDFSLQRYADKPLMKMLNDQADDGEL